MIVRKSFATSLVIFFLLAELIDAKFNLFITRSEMNRTLGVLAEMNYVENGKVNAYSTKFPYRVGSNVSHILFSWNNHAAQDDVRYSIRAVAETFDVLPVIHLPLEGVVPRKTETFAIEYRCAGSRAGQFMVTLFFNVSYPSAADSTAFTLKQEKICAPRHGFQILEGTDPDASNQATDVGGTIFEMPKLSQMVYLAIFGIVAVTMLITVIFCIVCRVSSRRHNKSTSADAILEDDICCRSTSTQAVRLVDSEGSPHSPFLGSDSAPVTSTPRDPKRPVKVPYFDTGTAGPSTSTPTIIFDRAQPAVDITTSLIELAADRNLFQVMAHPELEGTYGEVKWAIWRQNRLGISGDIDDEEDGGTEDIAVICKTLKPTADGTQFQKFLQEVLAFHNVPPHPNLAQVVGCATFGNFTNPDSITDFPLMAYRHQGFGNLKKFLLQCRGITHDFGAANSVAGSLRRRSGSTGGGQALRTHELLSMAIQVLKAIAHLHKYGIIHKDVAARNCLVSEISSKHVNDRLYVQLCDNALSRDLFPADYDCLGDNNNRAVKWMAPEAIKSNVFNSSSDVWSFGVTMWELFTCAQQPYAELQPEDMQAELERGARLTQPYICPDELYGAMYSCWSQDVFQRPTTIQLIRLLEDFAFQLRKYI